MWKAVAFRGAVDRGDLEEVNEAWRKLLSAFYKAQYYIMLCYIMCSYTILYYIILSYITLYYIVYYVIL